MEQTVYQKHGYKNRREYLKSLADEYGIDLQSVCLVAQILGPSEDFDGLISSLEDYDSMNGGEF